MTHGLASHEQKINWQLIVITVVCFRREKVMIGRNGRRMLRVQRRRCLRSGARRASCARCWRGCVGGARARPRCPHSRHPCDECSRATLTSLEPLTQGDLLEIISGKLKWYTDVHSRDTNMSKSKFFFYGQYLSAHQRSTLSKNHILHAISLKNKDKPS